MNDSHKSHFLPHRRTKEILGISDTTLRRWAKEGKIPFITTAAGHKHYDTSSFTSDVHTTSPVKVCYCRVSSPKQSPELDNQALFLQRQFPNHEIIKDLGSSLNWKRHGLIALLDRCFKGEISEVVVAHRDRLARFGFELLEYIFNQCQVQLVVLDQEVHSSGTTELADDILSIITVFSARYYGHRKYKHENTEDTIVSECHTETKVEGMDQHQ